MFSSAKRARDRSRSSQRRNSTDIHSERNSQIPEPASSVAAGTKRLFSNRQSKLSYTSDHGEDDEPNVAPGVHSDKRHRSGDWPLPASSPVESSGGPLRNRNAQNSPTLGRSSAQKRPSKFVEGSMNDRVSQKPPVPYLGTDEDFLEEYNAQQWDYNGKGKKPRPRSCAPPSNMSTTGTDTSRHSSIFRFGKSIAASFNPSNWKLFKSQHEQEVVETPQQRILRERREKAEKIYAELKESGHFPNMRTSTFEAFGDSKPLDKHDSGISFPETSSRMSTDSKTDREEKRKGRVFLDRPPLSGRRGESPASAAHSGVSTPSRTFSHFKQHSLSNIKKKFSMDGGSEYESDHQARKMTSRRDLNKQHKLSKRVSDLEGKLESARRQLNEALAEPLPPRGPPRLGRPKFVPGALPSLLSERLLSGYVQPDGEGSDEEEIGKAISYPLPGEETDDEVRGRSRSVRPEPRVMPTKFSKYSSTLGTPRVSSGASAKKNVQKEPNVKIEGEDDYLHDALTSASEVSSTKFSVYVDEGPQEEDDDLEADESTSVVSSSEPLSEATPKPKSKSKSTTPTPIKKQAATPKPTVSKTSTKKRKNSLDDDDVYKATASSADSEVETQPRVTPKRKSVTGVPVKKLQKTGSVTKSTPPTRPAPAIPSSAAVTPQQPPAKSIKSKPTSSPSPSTQTAAPITRIISRKAVSSTASTASRLQKSKPIAQSQGTQRQSVSPPPSSAFTGVSGLDYMKPTTVATNKASGEQQTEEKINPYPSARDDAIPPMPKLPKTVRLPSGEVVNVTANSRKRTGSTTSSRVSRSRAVKKSSNTSGSIAEKDENLVEMKDNFEKEGKDEKEKNEMSRSDTKASFEWPADVF